MFAKSRLGAVCYFVTDIKRTQAFYKDVLGLAVTRADDDGSGNPFLTAKTANNIELLFFKQPTKPGNSPIIVFEIEEGGIDDIVAKLAGKGVTIVTPVSHAPGGWTAEFADPDGHVLSMFQPEDKPRSRKKGK